ncbi:hypothetical protein P154DRAFT_47978 [Amniculicola lignicola CBS 123094]|uniref:Uncharacterized protein n=1 Tax=Amniculicola lignicola CBS 123094 TaxID=1392246 RepID=A0A6A5VYD1_9PLEO|nr:hypothetical protein P154DRAFT_47978 [Amniculicola lignicola CBS 123094]
MSGSFNSRFDPFSPEHTANLPDMDLSNIDWNDPASVFGALGGGGPGGLPIPKVASPTEIQKHVKEFSTQIFSDWAILKAILDRHESTIHKRWAKKGRKQRVELLLAAWPNMSATHRPDFLAFTKETERERERGTKFRDAYMWPYVNLEDLSKPKTVPLFLQARARSMPGAFTGADAEAAHIGYVTKAVVPLFLNEYTMMFNNVATAEGYAELISWDENDDAFEWMTSRKGMLPGEGLVILEMQHRVMHFLVDCCQRIMHDIPTNDLASDSYPTKPPVALAKETVDGFDSLAILAAEAPYRVPASMDLVRLESLLAAKKGAAEDHVWSLREDPGYFADAVFELKEHRQEMMKDSNGRDHHIFTQGQDGIFWQRVIKEVVAGAHLGLEVWSELHEQVKELRRLQVKHESSISVDEDLPEEYLSALLKFQHYINQAAKGPKGGLKHRAVASPPLRPYFSRNPPKDLSSTMIQITDKAGAESKMDKSQRQLVWLLQTLWEDSSNLFLLGLPNVVDELEHLLQSEPTAKKLISFHIGELISDLAVISEATRQLKIYLPWARGFENAMADREAELQKEFAQKTKGWGLVTTAVDGPNQKKIARLGEPDGKRFYYPVEKPRTKANVEAMRSAEQSLDAFWSSVDQNLRRRDGGHLKETALWPLLSQLKILQRTSECVESAKQTEENAIIKPLSELYLDLELRTERTIDRGTQIGKEPTTKAKTRGAPVPENLAEIQPAEAQTSPDEQTTFQLDPRALKVFRTLFYNPTLTATPGDVPWKDFLHALVSVGFRPEKLYGSVWQFSPLKEGFERSIQFHEPHPSGKIQYRHARRIGRRLNRAYGWNTGMFEGKKE